jgi:hypothetical protein
MRNLVVTKVVFMENRIIICQDSAQLKTAYELDLKKPIQGDLAELVALAIKELKKQNVEPPSGQAKIKRIGSSFKLEY